jgi:hypothetical protein
MLNEPAQILEQCFLGQQRRDIQIGF